MAELQYNWSSETCTDEGGNIFLKLSHAYHNVQRDGDTVTFEWGVRFRSLPYVKDGPATWTYNSVVIRPVVKGVEKNIYAMYNPSGKIHNETEEFIYASHSSPSGTYKWTEEWLPMTSTRTAPSVDGGSFEIEVGTAWNEFIPDQSLYTYRFSVPYPAAESYSVRYYANGGSGAPSTDTKYQGYSFYLSDTIPTRNGYTFTGWNTSSDGSGTPYDAGDYYGEDSSLTLYAQWKATAPIIYPPTVNATETTIYWSNFSVNINSYVYYKIDDESSWHYLGEGTSGFGTTIETINGASISPGSYHTVYFKATNANNTSHYSTYNVGISTYFYPYISGYDSDLDAGLQQKLTLYNPLRRIVTIGLYKVNGVEKHYVSTAVNGTEASFIIPIESTCEVMPSNKWSRGEYRLYYDGVVRSSKEGWINVPPATAVPVIDPSILWNDCFEYEDCAVLSINGEQRNLWTFTGWHEELLQGYSKLRYRFNSSYTACTGKYGATIKKYYITLNNKEDGKTQIALDTYYYEDANGASTTDSNSAVEIPQSSVYNIIFTAVDSRGFSTSAELSMGTHEMQSPSVTIASLVREDGYGTKAILTLSGRWCGNLYGYQVGRSLKVQYRPVGTSSWKDYYLYNNSDGSIGYSSLSGVYELNDITFDSGTAYEVRVLAYNGLGWSRYSTIETLSLGTPLLFLDEYQDGVGINCFPTGKGLSVDGFGHFTGNLTANSISASGTLVSSGYLETYSNLYVSKNAFISGNIYRNGFLTLDTDNFGSYALPLIGGNISGTINFTNAISAGKSAIVWHDWPEGTHDSYKAGVGYDTSGGEAITFWTKQNEGALKLMTGTDLETFSSGASSSTTPTFEASQYGIKKKGKNVPAVFIQAETPTATQVGDIWFII